MPTYEYVCTECGSPLEVVQSIHEPSLTECPQCHGRLRKVFGNVGVVFKGSGFYRTDSRAKTKAKAGSSGSGVGTEKTGTEKKADSPADGKASPAAKTPEKSTSSSGAAASATSTSSSTPAKSA